MGLVEGWTCPQLSGSGDTGGDGRPLCCSIIRTFLLWVFGCEKPFCWSSGGIGACRGAVIMLSREGRGGRSRLPDCSACLLICAHWEWERLTDTMPRAGQQAADGNTSPPHVTACSSCNTLLLLFNLFPSEVKASL